MDEGAPRKEVLVITPAIQAIIDSLKEDLPEAAIEERLAYAQQLREEQGLVAAAIRDHYTNLVSDALTAKILPEGVGEELLRLLEEKDEEGVRAIMEQHNIPVIYKEMLEGVLVIKNFKPLEIWYALDDEIASGKRFIFGGEGSSIAIPGEIAMGLAEKYGIEPSKVISDNCPKIQNLRGGDVVIISSNSGETGTALDLARRAQEAGAKTVAVTRNEDSSLVELCDKKIILTCGHEEAVGATKSVVEQILVTEAIVTYIDREEHGDIKALSGPFQENILREIPLSAIRDLAKADRLVIVGENGIPEELQLKAGETLGVKTSVVKLTDIMHGIEEAMDKRDCVLVFNPTPETIIKIEEKIVNRESSNPLKTKIQVIYIIPEGLEVRVNPERVIHYSSFLKSGSEKKLLEEALMHLAIGQNLLARAAYYTGKDCVPEHARKVGDEVVESGEPTC